MKTGLYQCGKTYLRGVGRTIHIPVNPRNPGLDQLPSLALRHAVHSGNTIGWPLRPEVIPDKITHLLFARGQSGKGAVHDQRHLVRDDVRFRAGSRTN